MTWKLLAGDDMRTDVAGCGVAWIWTFRWFSFFDVLLLCSGFVISGSSLPEGAKARLKQALTVWQLVRKGSIFVQIAFDV